MVTSRLNDINGLVINELKYGNTSKIITVFTKEIGLIKVMCQGAYRKNSPLSSLTNKYSLVNYNLNKGKNFYYIIDGESKENNFYLTNSLKLITVSGLVTELLEKTLLPENPEPDIYGLITTFFSFLKDNPEKIEMLLLSLIVKYSSFIGFRPNLKGCIRCGDKNNINYTINSVAGGAVCTNCAITTDARISKYELIYLTKLLYLPMSDNLDLSTEDINHKLLTKIMLSFLLNNLEIHELRIMKWLESARLI